MYVCMVEPTLVRNLDHPLLLDRCVDTHFVCSQFISPVLFICFTSQGFERLDHYEARFQLETPDEQPYCRPTNLTKRFDKVATHIKSELEPIWSRVIQSNSQRFQGYAYEDRNSCTVGRARKSIQLAIR